MSSPSSPRVGASLQSRYGESGSLSPDDDEAEEGDGGIGTFDGGGKWYGNSVSGSVAPVTMLEQVRHSVRMDRGTPSQTTLRKLTHVGPSNDGIPREPLNAQFVNFHANPDRPRRSGNMSMMVEDEPDSPLLQNGEPTAADLLQSLIRDCGLSANKLHDLMQELPTKQCTDLLIDYYFKNM